MACKCKVNRDLSYLQQNYGREKKTTHGEVLGFDVAEFFTRVLTFLLTIISLPFLVIFLLIANRKRKVINIDKLFRFNKAV